MGNQGWEMASAMAREDIKEPGEDYRNTSRKDCVPGCTNHADWGWCNPFAAALDGGYCGGLPFKPGDLQ